METSVSYVIPDKASFRLDEAAALFGVHVNTVRRWIDEEYIPRQFVWFTFGKQRRLFKAGIEHVLSTRPS